jgi:hypothetical protein
MRRHVTPESETIADPFSKRIRFAVRVGPLFAAGNCWRWLGGYIRGRAKQKSGPASSSCLLRFCSVGQKIRRDGGAIAKQKNYQKKNTFSSIHIRRLLLLLLSMRKWWKERLNGRAGDTRRKKKKEKNTSRRFDRLFRALQTRQRRKRYRAWGLCGVWLSCTARRYQSSVLAPALRAAATFNNRDTSKYQCPKSSTVNILF